MNRSRRRVLTVVAIVVIVAIAVASSAAYAVWSLRVTATTIQGGAREPTNLAVGATTIGTEGAQYLAFCGTPNGRFGVLVSIRNEGPLPITIEGADPGPGGSVSETHDVNGFSLEDLAAGRGDPRLAPVLSPTSLGPGTETTVFARFREGPRVDLTPGVVRFTDRIWVRVGIFGLARTVEVPLSQGVAMTGSCGA